MHLPADSESRRDPYQGVVIVLLAATTIGIVGAIEGGLKLANPVLFAIAVTLGISAGVLAGVTVAQFRRVRSIKHLEGVASSLSSEEPPVPSITKAAILQKLSSRLAAISRKIIRFFQAQGVLGIIRLTTALVGTVAICFLLLLKISVVRPNLLWAGIAAGLCLLAAGIAAIAVRYFTAIDPETFPESPALCRGARTVAWMLVLAAASIALAWADRQTTVRVLFFLVLIVNAAICYGLFAAQPSTNAAVFSLDIGVLSVFGARTNIFASILDAAEQQLGIDLRSTWALVVIRRSLEPLLLGLCLAGWLSTSLTVVGVEEQGLIERFGVRAGQPLHAGLHIHWPWPVDQVFRIPVQRVQVLEVGHEGNEAPGPENVLWAVEHAPNEFTLLLGNGRDLITVDAGVQFRITNVDAWRYHCQNPEQALSAIAYRAVMRNTVNLTLSEALSQNVALLAGRMKSMIQRDANALGLGVEILGFTVGGMHPPVAVAQDYQAVVSAELRKVTAVVNAQVERARILPEAEAAALVGINTARAEGAEALAKAAGEAWSFRTLESQYRAAPNMYFFRRRLETLEKGLSDREFTIVDSRIQRDGGELWVVP